MRVSWRLGIGIFCVGVWPQLGCLHPQADKAIQDEHAPVKTASAGKEAPPPAPLPPAAQAAQLERQGKYREAIAVYEQMRAPGNPDALLATKLLAGLYLRHGDLERAEQEYRTLLKQNPQDAGVLTYLGDINGRRAKWGAAEMMYSEALRYEPQNASARSGLAMSLAQQGSYARSIEEFKKVLKSEADAQCEVAFVMKMQGKEIEAFKAYQTALNLEPNNGRARGELTALKQKGVVDAPATLVRLTTPTATTTSKTGVAELVPGTPNRDIEGMSRLQAQRPTLPPLPDLDDGTER